MVARLNAGAKMPDLIAELERDGMSNARACDILGEACYRCHRKEAELNNRWQAQKGDAERLRRFFSDAWREREAFTVRQRAKMMEVLQQQYAKIRAGGILADYMTRNHVDRAGVQWGGH
jgi:hypothetical protein